MTEPIESTGDVPTREQRTMEAIDASLKRIAIEVVRLAVALGELMGKA